MKSLKKLFSLLLVLALLGLPALAEDEYDRTVYPMLTGDVAPAWSVWERVAGLAGIERVDLTGMNTSLRADGADAMLYCNALIDAEGLEIIACSLVEGELPAAGKVLAALASGRQVGDRLVLESGERSLELEVGGLLAPDPAQYEHPEALTELLIGTGDDFLALLDPAQEDAVSIGSIVLESADLVEDFVAEANELLADSGVNMLTAAQATAMRTGGSSAATGEPLVSAFGGTDLYGAPLPEAVLAPGGVTMVNVWATFCNYCIVEMPGLKALSEEYEAAGAPFRIVGVLMDATDFSGRVYDDLVETGRLIVEQTGADYLHILPDQQMFTELMGQVTAYPTTFFLNDAGEVLGVYTGAREEDAWRAIIDSYLK